MPWQRDWGRDPRLDFFRGIAMIIIFISHVPNNWSIYYIPAGYGPSDAAEIFVFCSGFAAAIAFGGTFGNLGYWAGVRRVLFRCWQIYWAYLCSFFFLMMCCAVAAEMFPEYGSPAINRISFLGPPNTTFFWTDPGQALIGLFTLTWVPNWFNILPLYFALLLMMPVYILLLRWNLASAIGLSIFLYILSWFFNFELTADAALGKHWFFNPFAWQLLFYSGFAFGSGRLRMPTPNRWLILAAGLLVTAVVPLSSRLILSEFEWAREFRAFVFLVGDYRLDFVTGSQKTDLHPIRYLHFLCLGYLACSILWGRERILLSRWVAPIMKIGQQALATYLTGLVLAWMGGVVIEQVGRTPAVATAVNLVGVLGLVAVAHTVAWYKAPPWGRPRKPVVAGS